MKAIKTPISITSMRNSAKIYTGKKDIPLCCTAIVTPSFDVYINYNVNVDNTSNAYPMTRRYVPKELNIEAKLKLAGRPY